MPTAAVFSLEFLPYSQTFVHEELRHHQRWDAEVFTWRRRSPERFPFEPVHLGGLRWLLTGTSPAFDRRMAGDRFALVHAHFGTAGMYAMAFALRHDLPLVITFHGVDVPRLRNWERLMPQHWPYAVLGPRMLQRMTLGLCASNELRELLWDMGVPEDRLVTHRLGIDLSAFRKGARDPERVRVIMIGRFVEKKGFEHGIRAFARVAATGASAHLTIVGDGPRRARLSALVSSLGIEDRVTFTGIVPSEEVSRHLASSDVLMAPSVVAADGNRESGVIVVKEASASEVVPIGTWHGGIPEIIDDGETGFLVPERNVDALTERLGRLVADPSLRQTLGRAARAKMEREYDNRVRVAELERHYDEACRRHRRRS